MRTTLTIDDDVAAKLERLREMRRVGLKSLVNELLRLGLQALRASEKPGSVYRTPGVDLGHCLIGNVDDVGEALAVAEGERFR